MGTFPSGAVGVASRQQQVCRVYNIDFCLAHALGGRGSYGFELARTYV